MLASSVAGRSNTTPNAAVAAALPARQYGTVGPVDPWVGEVTAQHRHAVAEYGRSALLATELRTNRASHRGSWQKVR
jgi:hypothetical protein